MRYIVLLLAVFSFSATATVIIPKNRVVCETQVGMKKVIKRKAQGHLKHLPVGCKKIDIRRRANIIKSFPAKRYVRVETKLGDRFFVDKRALKR